MSIPSVMATRADQIATALRNDDWCDRWFNGGLAKVTADFGLRPNSYSQPQLYQSADPKVWTMVWQRSGSYVWSAPVKLPAVIIPSTGTDNQFDLHLNDGSVVSGWQIIGPSSGIGQVFNRAAAWLYNRGKASMSDSFAATIAVFPAGDQGNTHTNAPAIPIWAGTPTPQEVASGAILKAMALTVPRSVSMSGPLAGTDITDCEDPTVGVTVGCSASPALFLESRYHSTPAELAAMVPDGMRWHLVMTDAEINAWLDARGFVGVLRNTARIFAVCLRDYGATQSQTGGYAVFPMDGSPAAQKQWKALGILPTTDLFGGLITRSRMRAVRPPTSTYLDGTTGTREGAAKSIGYVTAAG